MTELECGHCHYWLGESSTTLVYVEHVAKWYDVEVRPPRDLRICKQCGRVNVFIPRRDLDSRREAEVA